ncbi:hypothetical protein [Variovorax sp. DXTD-1]|uniref:hypothetical protein n=1 Tax=Variovorax sp. DXTD-1 TaxID=2495592 RepID=UPI000F885B71|nr:hypothetical protein [Variovorax sp. DXTD-1]RST53475.1 hypothetical protein EJI00_04260 [Variovorax sp. DXTD-1]
MSSSDSGSPTAARMLISLQRLESGGFVGATGFSTSGTVSGAGCAATATACGLGRVAAAGLGPAGLAAGGSAAGGTASLGTPAERHGVLHGLVSAVAVAANVAQHSATTIAIGAMAENGEDRTW